MNYLQRLMAGFALMMMVGTGFADNAALNETLVRLINQINAMMPLLDEASDETESNARLVFHIDSFVGPDGKKQAGVRDDLLAIRNSLIEFINQPAVAPKTIKPLALDYVGRG